MAASRMFMFDSNTNQKFDEGGGPAQFRVSNESRHYRYNRAGEYRFEVDNDTVVSAQPTAPRDTAQSAQPAPVLSSFTNPTTPRLSRLPHSSDSRCPDT